ncbi:MAG: DUF1127 domain-containing protein [Acetobacteraceae bacterium]
MITHAIIMFYMRVALRRIPVLDRLSARRANMRDQRALAALNPDLLRDIGFQSPSARITNAAPRLGD